MIRGDLRWVDFGVPLGSAAGYRRPSVILQADEYNETELNTIVVIPRTSNLRLAEYKPNIFISKEDSKLRKDSVALIPLVTALDRMCFIEKISRLPNKVTDEIYHALTEFLH